MNALIDRVVDPIAEPIDRRHQTVVEIAHRIAMDILHGDLFPIEREGRG